jgi:hypothetical protein
MEHKMNKIQKAILILSGLGILLLSIASFVAYNFIKIDVPAKHIAVLTKKTGIDLDNNLVVAPDGSYKGIQLAVLTEGRYFYNPYFWNWRVYPMVEIPAGKLGVRVRLYGDNLPYGHFLATKESQKGVVPEVLRPGRYPINAAIKGLTSRSTLDYVEVVELYDPIDIPAGYRGVVTNLAGPLADNPNVLLVDKGFRGVQKEALDAGTYYLNPYLYSVDIVDCRSQRFNLGEGADMGFPSKDGFWVTLDGIVEFRINPERAAEIFVTYNDLANDKVAESAIMPEIIQKIIMPNARAFCRMRGSNAKGRDFIGGETRSAFQKEFQEAMKLSCDSQGVEIQQALVTKINPPQAIAKPVRDREVARQKMGQFKEQKLQQDAEANLAIERALIEQRRDLVQAEQEVVKSVTLAKQEQQIAITKANEDKRVAELDLLAAKDQAAAMMSRKKAEASIIDFRNTADASGWKKAVESLKGDGNSYARFVLYQRLAPSFKQMTVNTADSPLMEVFRQFGRKEEEGK